ncbi:hypothetical protein DPV78_000278 [Talaromyces pinophilus]|nr:hypothetical protein DPV78_000278 [Talaromyces pinophilus]
MNARIVINMSSLYLEQKGPCCSERLFCVYNWGLDENILSFLIEYKALYKLSLTYIKAGLQDMELDRII